MVAFLRSERLAWPYATEKINADQMRGTAQRKKGHSLKLPNRIISGNYAHTRDEEPSGRHFGAAPLCASAT